MKKVSIIISTYNRPNVLDYAIRSIISSNYSNYEIIIVGDCCSEETEIKINEFDNENITYYNLDKNTGGQSEPNNIGLGLSTGEYILYLNHDDIYFPDHIANCVTYFENNDADMLWVPVAVLSNCGADKGPLDIAADSVYLDGAVNGVEYNPEVFIIASSWAVRRSAALKVGSWVSHQDTRLSPSQEWIFRAHMKGLKIRFNPIVSVLCIHAGVRPFSYLRDRSIEHEKAWLWLENNPDARVELTNAAAISHSAQLQDVNRNIENKHRQSQGPVVHRILWWLWVKFKSIMALFGTHPVVLSRWVEGEKKGDWINTIRELTGHAPVLNSGQPLDLSDPVAGAYLGNGWHSREDEGRWTCAKKAEVFFSVDSFSEGMALEISWSTLIRNDPIIFEIDGVDVSDVGMNCDGRIQVPIPRTTALHRKLTISTNQLASPFDLSGALDRRTLGVFVKQIKIIEVARMDQ